ncbi:hypothetical protein [Kineococcus sp. R86509]|uniref:hypothetical protein n=1 Tax=Kineococcus sp. R86509 TaxID=3093851 RepID=UPI0036D2A75A
MDDNPIGPQPHPRGGDQAERAAHTVDVLRLLWGEELPPGQDPAQTVMTDAVYIDDERGRALDLIVQGDGLTLEVLHQLLQARGSLQDRLLLLPPDLADRLTARVVEISLDAGSHSAPAPANSRIDFRID